MKNGHQNIIITELTLELESDIKSLLSWSFGSVSLDIIGDIFIVPFFPAHFFLP